MSDAPPRENLDSAIEPIPQTGSANSLEADSAEAEYLDGAGKSGHTPPELLVAQFLRHHSGPLPSPEILAAYEKVLPGAAERIFGRFEAQSDHRMKMEADVVSSNTFSQRWSTILASVIALLVTAGTLFLTHEGRYAEGLSIFFVTLFSFLGTYVIGKKFQAEERRDKAVETAPEDGEETSS